MSRKAESAIVAEAKQSIESDVLENPYESPRTPAEPDEVLGPSRDSKPTPEQKRRWRRAVVPCILLSLAVGCCGSLQFDSKKEGIADLVPAGLLIGLLPSPAIVGHWLVLTSTGRRRLANTMFGVCAGGWLAVCGLMWLRHIVDPVENSLVGEIMAYVVPLVVVSHIAAYLGIRIGMRR